MSSRAPSIMVAVGVAATAAAVAAAAWAPEGPILGGYLTFDATARLFLAAINPIFLGVSVYVRGRVSAAPELRAGIGRFVALSLVFLAAANVVIAADHLLLQWIALEATSLAAAPLIVRRGVPASRRASFRYLLFSSVGLGLVLLGLALAPSWTELGLALALLGLGTKLGLAPMYSWLPEAYDEAPPATAALLGAVQFNCALVMLFRVVQAHRPGHEALIRDVLTAMGLTSMLVSTLSIVATRNLKRLIAYASINHAGVIAIGLGAGKPASYGLLLYVLSNAFIKAVLFLTAGKITAHHRTKDTRAISGLVKDLPYSGVFLMVGTFALLGFPPFGSFFGELLILSALATRGQMLVFASFCALITVTFAATGRTIFPMIWGESKALGPRQTFLPASPKIAFVVALVALGMWIPPPVNRLIRDVATSLEDR